MIHIIDTVHKFVVTFQPSNVLADLEELRMAGMVEKCKDLDAVTLADMDMLRQSAIAKGSNDAVL